MRLEFRILLRFVVRKKADLITFVPDFQAFLHYVVEDKTKPPISVACFACYSLIGTAIWVM